MGVRQFFREWADEWPTYSTFHKNCYYALGVVWIAAMYLVTDWAGAQFDQIEETEKASYSDFDMDSVVKSTPPGVERNIFMSWQTCTKSRPFQDRFRDNEYRRRLTADEVQQCVRTVHEKHQNHASPEKIDQLITWARDKQANGFR